MDFRIVAGSVFVGNIPDFLSAVRSVSSANNSIIQAMDADRIAGEEHVIFAIRKALRAIDNNTNIAHDIGIEIMRYASGKKQIGDAFSLGVREGQMNVVFVVLGEIENIGNAVNALKSIIEESPLLEYSDIKRAGLIEQFCITEKEIRAVGEQMIPSLVLERVALVDVLK